MHHEPALDESLESVTIDNSSFNKSSNITISTKYVRSDNGVEFDMF